jgi:hypothetical protein
MYRDDQDWTSADEDHDSMTYDDPPTDENWAVQYEVPFATSKPDIPLLATGPTFITQLFNRARFVSDFWWHGNLFEW